MPLPRGVQGGTGRPAEELGSCWAFSARHGGHLDVLTFKERADLIRDECRAERAAATDDQGTAGRDQVLFHERPLNAVPQTRHRTPGQYGGWQILSIAIGSGAAEAVIPHKLVTMHPIKETEASRSGVNYVSATGDPIPNLGEQLLPLCTREATLRSMTFQAAPVTRALGSVKRICQSGHRVVFDDDMSYIENKETGEINVLREEDGN